MSALLWRGVSLWRRRERERERDRDRDEHILPREKVVVILYKVEIQRESRAEYVLCSM